MQVFNRRQQRELDALVEEYVTRRYMPRREFLQKVTAAGLSLSAASALLAACGGPLPFPADSNTPARANTIVALTEWNGNELDAFNAQIKAFRDKTGINVTVESTRDLLAVLDMRLRGNSPPDICGMPSLSKFQQLAKQGKLVQLDKFLDMNKIQQDYAKSWLDLASVDGKLYAVLPKANTKNTIWYNPRQFQAAGGTIPRTWDDLIAVSNRLAESGKYPWAMGVESSASSGWPATDWVSLIYVNKYGPYMYDQWVAHKIPWTHPSIKDAIQMFGQIVQGKHYINGAPQSILTTGFREASYQPFTNPPKAYMCCLGDFTAGFITDRFKTLQPGKDFDFFSFPLISPQYKGAIIGGADIMVAMKDNDGTRKFMTFMATAEAQTIWVKRGGSTAINKMVSQSDYPNDVARQASQMLVNATSVHLSVGDIIPASLQSVYWKGMLRYIQDPQQLDSILDMLEAAAQQVYQS
ncbi:MAG: carbohydrate ABC transporter substrate-binding protein [Ktedonobacteraceae bacterium]|nr:carbohydrate ABC transporter substrate-binding protein [Ktedonobacteraceae bacterium]